MCWWRSRGLNPGLSACKADALPLSYTPFLYTGRGKTRGLDEPEAAVVPAAGRARDALAKKKKAAEVPRPRPYITARGCSSVAERPLCMRKAQGSNPCSSSLPYAVGTGFPELTRYPLRRKRRTRPRARARSSAERPSQSPAEQMHDKLPTGFHGLVSLSNIGELTHTYESSPCPRARRRRASAPSPTGAPSRPRRARRASRRRSASGAARRPPGRARRTSCGSAGSGLP